MAKKAKTAKPKRLGFGRREKLVALGIVGIVGVGALHFIVFKPRVDALSAAERSYQQAKGDFEVQSSQVYDRRLINSYDEQTRVYREQLYEVIGRFNFSTAALETEEPARRTFIEHVEHLSAKWLEHQRTRDPEEGTDLVFIGQMAPDQVNRVARGQFFWNIPESLPRGVTESVIRDNLDNARGTYRLIQRVRNERPRHQTELDTYLSALGIPVPYLGADPINLAEPFHVPYRLGSHGITVEETSERVPYDQWPSYRLPAPIDSFCAVAHMNLLLDALYPPPLDAAMMEQARRDPALLSPEDRLRYDQWVQNRETEMRGGQNQIGLEDLLNVHYSPVRAFFNLGLDHVERMVDLAIEDGISRIIMVKILEQQDLLGEPLDPWELPPEPEEDEEVQVQSRGPRGMMSEAEMYMMGGYAGGEGEMMMMGEYGYAAAAAAPVEPAEPAYVWVSPIFIQVTGDYSRVMEYFLDLATGPSFYTVEQISIYTTWPSGQPITQLPEGHVMADIWVNAPIWVPGINDEFAARASEFVVQREAAADATSAAPTPQVAAGT